MNNANGPAHPPAAVRAGWRIWLTAMLVFLADAAAAAEAGGTVPVLSTGNVMRIFIGLILVLAAILLLSVLLKKMNMLPGQSSAVIRPVSSIALNGKDKLVLIEVGEEQLLLSVSPGRISKIHKLRTPVILEQVPADSGLSGKKDNKFANILVAALTGQKP